MSDSIFLLGVLIIIIVALAISVAMILRRLSALPNGDTQSAVLLHNQLNALAQSLDSKLRETNQIIREQLTNSNSQLQMQHRESSQMLHKLSESNSKILQEVTEKLVKVEDTNKQVINFAEQLQSLENILKSPKQRGLLGEYFLQTMLANVLPSNVFKMQYPFRDGVIVDAVIFIRDMIIPIDAKFSLESYTRLCECKDQGQIKVFEKEFLNDVKKRIDETSKYVKPEESTIDVVFMFVPADGVYNEIIKLGNFNASGIDIVQYAYSKKVVIVSPTSFFAYLQTLIQALNTLRIEKQVQEIIVALQESTKYLKTFEENMNKLGKNIHTMVNSYNATSIEATKMSKRISKITGNDLDVLALEKIESLPE